MSQPSSGRPMPFIAGAFLAFVVLSFALPSKAQAACGHYSLSTLDRDVEKALADLDVLSIASGSEAAIPEAPSRKPCSGPSCSEGRSQPSAPSLANPPTGERWLYSADFADLAALNGSLSQVHEPSPRPVSRSITLERPPRSLPA